MSDLRQLLTLRQHYYPEGGWGIIILIIAFIVQCISHGLHMSSGILITAIIAKFHQNLLLAGKSISLSKIVFFRHTWITKTFWILFSSRRKKISITIKSNCFALIVLFFVPIPGIIGSLSICVALLISPVAIAFCRRKSTRLLAVIGGLIMTLGCLFTSFAQQFHQVLFSYGKFLQWQTSHAITINS